MALSLKKYAVFGLRRQNFELNSPYETQPISSSCTAPLPMISLRSRVVVVVKQVWHLADLRRKTAISDTLYLPTASAGVAIARKTNI